jgi:hypothetical protein
MLVRIDDVPCEGKFRNRTKRIPTFKCDFCAAEFQGLLKKVSAERHFCNPKCLAEAIKAKVVLRGAKPNQISPTTHVARHKICDHCYCEYCDITRRNTSKMCSQECSTLAMVEARKQNGTYQRSEEQNQKLSATLRQMHANSEIKYDSERLSQNAKRAWAEGKTATGQDNLAPLKN